MIRISKRNKELLCALNELTSDIKGIASDNNINKELVYIKNVRNMKGEIIAYNNYEGETANVLLDDSGRHIINILQICNKKFEQKINELDENVRETFNNPRWYQINVNKLKVCKQKYEEYKELENNLYYDIIRFLV